MRLQKYLASCGVASRRASEKMIAEGRVSVDGSVITEMGTKVEDGQIVCVDGKPVTPEAQKYYVMYHKPAGEVITVQDPEGRATVLDRFRDFPARLYPVGRLDYDSEGLLLLTNDGDLTKTLTHPSYEKRKVYQVTLDKALTKADMEQIVEGITLEDGFIQADQVSYVGESKKEVGIEIHSGRNRIVRRIFEHLGYTVTKLDRVLFAGLTKKNLKRGQWRFLTPQEVAMLKSRLYE
jgi:23S rRNA pseudouridine2605 synthase